ncbi:MAG: tetratricopeptide repeat protein, partial [Bacteroidota bacterium]
MKKTFFLITLLNLLHYTSFSQDQHLVDSLEKQLSDHNAQKLELGSKAPAMYDTIAANILNQISRAYWGNNPRKAIDNAKEALALAEQIGYKKGIANAYNSLGAINQMKGEYLTALELHRKALKIREEIGDKQGIASSYN